MCTNLQTQKGQAWIPDFLKDTTGTSVTIPDRQNPKPTDMNQPLMPSDYETLKIENRRKVLRDQYETNPGSVRPIEGLSRRDIMEELTQ